MPRKVKMPITEIYNARNKHSLLVLFFLKKRLYQSFGCELLTGTRTLISSTYQVALRRAVDFNESAQDVSLLLKKIISVDRRLGVAAVAVVLVLGPGSQAPLAKGLARSQL